MPVPSKIREHLAQRAIDPSALPGQPLEAECQGAEHHSPRPIVLHSVDLPDDRSVILCGTCRDNLGTLLSLMQDHPGQLPWPVRREFGNIIRALARC